MDVREIDMDRGEVIPPPVSRGRRVAARFVGWLRDWLFWDERVPGAVYRQAVAELVRTRDELLKVQVQLSTARAEKAAAAQECIILAAVCKRNEERVQAELAQAAARREANLLNESKSRATRTNGAD